MSGGGVNIYKCSSLLSDQEVQQATSLSDAALFNQESQSSLVKGQTYCQYFAKGGVSIAVSVLTGPAFDQVYKPLEAAAQGQVAEIPGLGDSAGWSAAANALGTRVDSTGVTIIFANTGGGSFGIPDPESAAVVMAKIILSRL